jgi:hypothetical protein
MQAQVKPLSRTETPARRTKPFPWRGPLRGAVAPHNCIEPGHKKWTIDRRRNDGFPPSSPARSRLVPIAPAAAPRPGPPASCPAVRVDNRQTGNEPFMTGSIGLGPSHEAAAPFTGPPASSKRRKWTIDSEAARVAQTTSRRQSRRHGRTPSLRPIHRRLTLTASIRAAWLSGRPDEPSIKVDGTFA